MTPRPSLSRAEAVEAQERHRNDGKAPRAEALFLEALDRADMPLLALWLSMRAEVGKELTPAEEAEVRERLDAPRGTGL